MTCNVIDKREHLSAGPLPDPIGDCDIAMTAVEVRALIEHRAQVGIDVTAILPQMNG